MKKLSKYAVLITTLLLCFMVFRFIRNLNDRFERVDKAYKDKTAINLSAQMDTVVLRDILVNNGYVKNVKDASYISKVLKERLQTKQYDYLYILQKRAFGMMPACEADSLGRLTNRLDASRRTLGQDSIFNSLNMASLKSTTQLGNGEGTIRIKIVPDKDKVESCKDVVIRLRKHYLEDEQVCNEDILCVKTDSLGCASITGLNKNVAYSVLPIKKYYEYGSEKGIAEGKFKKNVYEFEFTQLEHRIPMFDNITLKQMKYDGTITVRTPSDFKAEVIKWMAFVILGWWLLCIVLIRRKKNFDPLIVAAAMFLSGLCVLMMFAIQNPLSEELRGVEMAKGVLIGIFVVALFQYVDFIKLYQNRYKIDFDIPLALFNWLFLPFKKKVAWLTPVLKGYYRWHKKFAATLVVVLLFVLFIWLDLLRITKLSYRIERLCLKLPRGIGWFILAIILTAMMFLGPFAGVVGGMTVNLKLGPLTFQPSEIAKYLMLFFMAAFFTQHADAIIQYSQPGVKRLTKKVRLLFLAVFSILVLMGLYLALGDMGPGLVVCITFILLYSLVKSKVNLENLNETDKWRRIFTCDFAILLYGIVSFAAFLIFGYILGKTVRVAIVFGVLWFVLWIIVGWAKKRKFYETAFIMNLLIFMFVFGGQMIKSIEAFKDLPLAERFEQRSKMCVNTWGDLDEEHHGEYAEPVSNNQVANGLWAIATGGFNGQGFGKGNANLIPAFHTDMILSSIGEQIGWIGLVAVVLVLALLLRRIVVLGYNAGHPFAFYFCLGVAVVTGVQFFIIALGSSGMIPLTGITVPLLSYGKVSMILNIAAIGVVLSFGNNWGKKYEEDVEVEMRRRSVGDYNYPVTIVSWIFVVLAMFTLIVWQYYAVWNRDNTLVRPAYVHNKKGVPIIDYNPRIALLTREMYAGNIFDRNGIILATSNKDRIDKDLFKKTYGVKNIDSITTSHNRRYYPFGEQMFFMIGDINTGLFFTYDENNPIGYMAEAQHFSKLRGFDNLKRDEQGNPVIVKLDGNIKSDDRFLDVETHESYKCKVRKYDTLVPFLKAGVYSDMVKEHNKKVEDGMYHIDLTVDVMLQKRIQDTLELLVNANQKYSKNKLLRVSVVVLDAEHGDLLTSANYPLPDYQRMKEEDLSGEKIGKRYYYDRGHDSDKKWKAYTDKDLGLTFQTEPGSTAKIMSGLAGLNKIGVKGIRSKKGIFDIQRYEVIDIDEKTGYSKEPPMDHKPHEEVSMKKAIVKSSNCYFINLVNEYDLYSELDSIYSNVGISLNGGKSYFLDYDLKKSLSGEVKNYRTIALSKYNKYKEEKAAGSFTNDKDTKKLKISDLMWAWGQDLYASPLNMARVASSVVNKGKMPKTRYMLTDKIDYVTITSEENAAEMHYYMYSQAHDNEQSAVRISKFPDNVGGKTGTPERPYVSDKKEERNINDGWYVFYIDNKVDGKEVDGKPSLAVAIRLERVSYRDRAGSADAMFFAKDLMPILQKYRYKVK